LRGGTAVCVWDDRLRPILEAMGELTVRRATEVEWEGGEWVARLLPEGMEIGRGKNRADVVRKEVEYLEREVISHVACR
jgi:hypothetical protein